MSVPPASSPDSADPSGASEPKVSSEAVETSGNDPEELTDDSELPSSLEAAPPLHAARENTSVMDNKSDSNFFILIDHSFLLLLTPCPPIFQFPLWALSSDDSNGYY